MPKPITIEVQYISGCGSAPPTLRLIERVARELGILIELREVMLDPQADFVKLRFRGSPSVLVSGLDVEPVARACEVYGPG